MLLLLLLSLAAVSHLSGARVPFTTSAVANISSCPVAFYGQLYKTLYVELTGGNVTICFKGSYSNESNNDCILITQGQATKGYMEVQTQYNGPGSFYHGQLEQLTGSASCNVAIDLQNSGSQLVGSSRLIQFGEQGVLYVYVNPNWSSNDLEAIFQVDGDTVDVGDLKRSAPNTKDISGCRHSGVVLLPNTTTCDSERGPSLTCSPSAVFSVRSCSSCQGDGQCFVDATCTVTGSTVIDIGGNVASVPDRCAYTLMSESGFQLLAVFQERRRRDVSFVDQVILHLDDPGVNFNLGQGGRVQMGNIKLSLGSSPVQHHGVELSKDQAGVTAKLVHSNYNISVFFDGYTAQIHITVPWGTTLQGLCGNSSLSLSELRVSEHSSSGCETQYNDTAGSKIDCKTITERCNLLKEAPFTSCHNHIDPEPYITACTNTLCKYPPVDGLNCQFLEAYARACSLHSNETLQGWRSKANCSSPQAFCQDKFCSAHEFCAEDISGGISCYCRATFGSKYRSTNTLGEPTVCRHNSASLTLVGCLLEERSIDYSVLHLNDPKCRGQRDNQTHMVTFNFDSSNACGTVVRANSSQIMYKNAIMTRNSSAYGLITRHDQVNIDFSCFYNQPDIRTMAFKIKDSSVMQQIISEAWNYTLTMNAFTDAGHTQAVNTSTAIQLEQTIWVELKTDGLDDKLVSSVIDSCWATNEASPNGSLRYNLIVKGCSNPADQTVKVKANGSGLSNYFSFNMFQFSGKSGDVYLHCKLNLCVKKKNSTCTPGCSGGGQRSRRSARTEYEDENPAFITMAWTN